MKTGFVGKRPLWLGALMAVCLLVPASGLMGEVVFTEVTEGELATDEGHFFAPGWGDYDGDGFVDLILTDLVGNRLYHNNGNGSFTKITSGPIVDDSPADGWPAWADYDNDGDLDLFMSSFETPDRLYRNQGDGSFFRIPDGETVEIGENKWGNSASWGNLNNDGFVDLFVGNTGAGSNQVNYLYLNNGDGTMTGSPEPSLGITHTHLSLWSDYDMDGDVDLLVAQNRMRYRNDEGTLVAAVGEPFNLGNDIDISSADFDNDGDLDLVVVGPDRDRLYENDGAGNFTEVHTLATGSGTSACAVWGDFDNDGKIDLFIAKTHDKADFLFHNDGGGGFSPVIDIPLVTRLGHSWAAAWADYDNDGDLDLLISDGLNENDYTAPPRSCALYRNDIENQNKWLIVALRGTFSNGTALGAKVYATATINNEEVTQLREINGHNTELRAHFGLGDATIIDKIVIEWPSGRTSSLINEPVNQILNISESPMYGPWPVNENGYCDTTSWVKWLWVENDPWVWSVDMNHWLYCPGDNVTESGAWVYIPK